MKINSIAANLKTQINNFRKLFYILIILSLIVPLSAQSKSKDVLLFEIDKYSNPGGGGMGRRLSSLDTFFIYKSGRIACKSLSYDPRGKEIKSNKSKCLQISRTKVSELLELAEQTDFQTKKYQYFAGGVDWGKSLSITYFNNNGNKEIFLTNPKQANNIAQIPISLEKFLDKLGEISKTLKVEYELGKK